MRCRRREHDPEWLGLGDASRFLGVSPETLRRWSNAGRVHTFTTPGGHRRYRRSTLERLAPADASTRSSLLRPAVTPARLARAYRTEAHAAAREFPWLVALDEQQRDWFRRHGRLLADELLAYLDASGQAAEHHLSEATTEAAAYGRMASSLGVSLSQSIEGFLQFRRPFLHEVAEAAKRRGMDLGSTTELLETTERAMDRLLIAAMGAHSVDRGSTVLGTASRRTRRVESGSGETRQR